MSKFHDSSWFINVYHDFHHENNHELLGSHTNKDPHKFPAEQDVDVDHFICFNDTKDAHVEISVTAPEIVASQPPSCSANMC